MRKDLLQNNNEEEKKMKIDIIHNEMDKDMTQYATDQIKAAIELYEDKFDIVLYMMNRFDQKYGEAWNCIIGLN